ncbi:hypothetical protein ABJY89_14720, partial [Vibrio parahaemolyticus]|uniref:hypothetical protein n=1 Tax=Vibrio parahaemolyticus TaxID=670 RepID=UPI0032AF0FC3
KAALNAIFLTLPTVDTVVENTEDDYHACKQKDTNENKIFFEDDQKRPLLRPLGIKKTASKGGF